MSNFILSSVLAVVLVSGTILMIVRPRIVTLSGGLVHSEIALASLRDIARVSRWYRWLGLVSTFMLVLSFPFVIFFVYDDGLSEVSGLTAVFEGILFVMVRLIFKRVDRYENLLQQLLTFAPVDLNREAARIESSAPPLQRDAPEGASSADVAG